MVDRLIKGSDFVAHEFSPPKSGAGASNIKSIALNAVAQKR